MFHDYKVSIANNNPFIKTLHFSKLNKTTYNRYVKDMFV